MAGGANGAIRESLMPMGEREPGASKLHRLADAAGGRVLGKSSAAGRYGVALALALAYYVGVQIGFEFTLETNAVSTLWPPNAIVLAVLLLAPPRAWPLLIAAVLPVHLATEYSLGVPLTMALLWYVSNVTQALLGAGLIVFSLGRAPCFDRVRDVSVFLIAAGLIAPAVASFIDAGFVASVGWRYDGDYWRLWRTRLLSNVLATLTVAPLILIWATGGLKSMLRARAPRYAEVVALLIMLWTVSIIVFHRDHPAGEAAVYLYAPLPILLWAAVRLGVGGVSLGVAMVAMFAITGVLRDRGPFALAPTGDAVLALQVFLIIAASSLTLLAASLAELRDARADALRKRESLDVALNAAQMGAWDWDMATDRIAWRLDPGADRGDDRGFSMSTAGLLELVHADDRPIMANALNAARERRGSHDVECRFDCGGTVRWIMSKGKVLLDEKGEPRRMIGVCIDSTQRKAQEIQMHSQRDQLAHLSRVAMLGELSGALAHELSQPLAAILINAQAAQQGLRKATPDLTEIAEILADIVADDKRAAEVIRRLRALLLRGAVQMESVSVSECVREVLALAHSDLIARNVAAEVRLGRDLPAVMADRVQLQQVLLNLIGNACDAMTERGAGPHRLQIVGSASEDGWVHIEVRDNGRGVQNLERIFEPFFSSKSHGIGLGLAISRTIIGTHRGRLWATNNASGGATFHITLPVAQASVTQGTP